MIKCGGSVFEKLPNSFYENIVQLQKSDEWAPVIVHGGGPMISTILEQLKIETKFKDGLRVTTEDVLDVVEMVLSGSMNKKIVANLAKVGGKAVGLSGIDGQLLKAKPSEDNADLGFVGEVEKVNPTLIKLMAEQGYIPVISPLGIDDAGQRYNINGDTAASAVAKELEAKLCFISDIPGILVEEEGEKKVLNKATTKIIDELIESKVIYGGMVPKVKAAVNSLGTKVTEVSILSGIDENSLIDYVNGMDVGTKIMKHEEAGYAK